MAPSGEGGKAKAKRTSKAKGTSPTEGSFSKAKGGTRLRGSPIKVPRLHIFPPSLNSGKAHVALLASSVGEFQMHTLGILGANYTNAFARLSPSMSVPVLEIDDKIITDSIDIIRYLRKHYPGCGDQPAEVEPFLALVDSWSEGLWNYAIMARQNMPVSIANDIRLHYLRRYRAEAEEDEPELLAAYDKKISYITKFNEAIAADGTEMKKASDVLDKIMLRSEQLLEEHGGPFLFGETYTDADSIMAPVIQRLRSNFAPHFSEYCHRHQNLAAYLTALQATKSCAKGTFFGAWPFAPLMARDAVPYLLFHTIVGGCVCVAVIAVGASLLGGSLWKTILLVVFLCVFAIVADA